MTIWMVLMILSIVFISAGIVWCSKDDFSDGALCMCAFGGILAVVMIIVIVLQPISLNKIQNRQTKERQQIERQIAILDESKDTVKLNEWILTYNDWVNDVNTNKETFGWFSWYRDFDMTEHKIIELQ